MKAAFFIPAVSAIIAATLSLVMLITGQADKNDTGSGQSSSSVTAGKENSKGMKLEINGNKVDVMWESNDAVDALRELCSSKPVEIDMSMYGGFEQVGDIGKTLPSDDTEITTEPGDIVLYSSDKIVVFYGSNSWNYTRLGHITDSGSKTLKDMLGKEDVKIRISAE